MKISDQHIKKVAETFSINPKTLKDAVEDVPGFRHLDPIDQGIQLALIAKEIADHAAARKRH